MKQTIYQLSYPRPLNPANKDYWYESSDGDIKTPQEMKALAREGKATASLEASLEGYPSLYVVYVGDKL